MFERGKRSLAIGAFGLILIAVFHTLGFLATPSQLTPAQAAWVAEARTLPMVDAPGMHASAYQVLVSLSLVMAFACLALGLQSLFLLRALPVGHRALKVMAWSSLLFCVANAVMGWVTRVAPPFLTFSLLTPVYLVALLGRGPAKEG
jgi:hypothetical protein